jgi:hypothetical protein
MEVYFHRKGQEKYLPCSLKCAYRTFRRNVERRGWMYIDITGLGPLSRLRLLAAGSVTESFSVETYQSISSKYIKLL